MSWADDTEQRLFFALWPDAGTRARLAELTAAATGMGGRAPHPQDLHVTLAFLGQVSSEAQACVGAAAAAVRADSFSVTLDQIGYWRRPRILWCGCQSVPPQLPALLGQLWQGLKTCGFPPEQRPYHLHVTLARKLNRGYAQPLSPPIVWRVGEFVLVESMDVRQPPRYRILGSWPLGS